MATTQFHPVVQELIDMIAQNGWQSKFEEALKKAQSYNVIGFEDVKTDNVIRLRLLEGF